MRTILLTGAGGGHGASTVAAALATYLAERHRTTLVVDDTRAMATLMGAARPARSTDVVEVSPSLAVAAGPIEGSKAVVVDRPRLDPPADLDAERYVVLRGPCYLALAALLEGDGDADGVILVAERGRSLTARDVADVLGIPVIATAHVTPVVARSIDAGLLLQRLPSLRELRPLREIVTQPGPLPRARSHGTTRPRSLGRA